MRNSPPGTKIMSASGSSRRASTRLETWLSELMSPCRSVSCKRSHGSHPFSKLPLPDGPAPVSSPRPQWGRDASPLRSSPNQSVTRSAGPATSPALRAAPRDDGAAPFGPTTISGAGFFRRLEHSLYSSVVGLQSWMEPQRDTPMLNTLLDHSPAFVIGELILALCLATFVLALLGTVRERYSSELRCARKGPSPSLTTDARRLPVGPAPQAYAVRSYKRFQIHD